MSKNCLKETLMLLLREAAARVRVDFRQTVVTGTMPLVRPCGWFVVTTGQFCSVVIGRRAHDVARRGSPVTTVSRRRSVTIP